MKCESVNKAISTTLDTSLQNLLQVYIMIELDAKAFNRQVRGLLCSIALVVIPAYADSDSFISPADSDVAAQVSKSSDPTVVREKVVSINSGLIKPSADLKARAADATADIAEEKTASTLYVEVDFFGDPILLVLDSSTHIGKNNISWIGHVHGAADSQVVIVVGERGIAQGNITYNNKKYHIRYVEHKDGKAIHTLQEIDMSKFPDDHPPGLMGGAIFEDPGNSIESQPDANDASAADISQQDASVFSEADETSVVGSGAVIDVMILYTADAENSVGNAAAMEVKIALAIAETNQGYETSGIAQRMNLIHSQKVTYTETGDIAQDLSNLGNTTSRVRKSDGSIVTYTPSDPNPFAFVNALRDEKKADLIGLLVSHTNYSHTCGLGNLGPSTTAAFQVTNENCATGYYSFAHEFGHNQGAHHDRRIAGSPGDNKYQYGYVKPDKSWRTIMAYNDSTNCVPPSGYNSNSCLRQNFWSNPKKSYNGDPTGVDSIATNGADNAKWMNEKAYTVTNHQKNHATYELPHNEWRQIGLPYAPSSGENKVSDILSDDIVGTIGTDWAIYKYDSATGYTALEASSIMEQGVGYWIKQLTGSTVTLDLDTPSGFSETLMVTSNTKCPSSSGCFETPPLPTAAGTHKWSMLSNPYPQNKQVKGIIVDSSNASCQPNGCTFDEATTNSQVHNKIFHYNPTTNTYDELTSTDYLSPWVGFWFATLQGADGTSPKLLFPSNEQR